jgi:hypothetical protein
MQAQTSPDEEADEIGSQMETEQKVNQELQGAP